MKTLDQELLEYSRQDYYPFHMPGHKRNMNSDFLGNPFDIDITEITGFDNLHHAEGILLKAQQRAAKIYGADKTYFLVNGSTAGILSAISACTTRKGKLIMARNCHKAAYHGAYLRELQVAYLYPDTDANIGLSGGISCEEVTRVLNENPDAQAVFLTSPTYDGMLSDIEGIANIVHDFGKILIVDEAHGAHLAFYDGFPKSALSLGADIVINSLHKTMPCLTQTALLHVKGDRVDREVLERFLGIYQTSSPSYVFMASMDAGIQATWERREELFPVFEKNLTACRDELKKMKHLVLVDEELVGQAGIYDIDKSKIVVSCGDTGLSGAQLHDRLRETYHLEMEMEAPGYILALASVMDSKEGFKRLAKALLEIDAGFDKEDCKEQKTREQVSFSNGRKVLERDCRTTIAAAMEADYKEVLMEESAGFISAEFLYLYPPGIPLLTPGEQVPDGLLKDIEMWKERGLYIQGCRDYTLKKICVLNENQN